MSDKLAENIKRRRLALGLTQQALADRLGYTSKQAITKIESGDNNMPLAKVEAFAKALETTPQELLQFPLSGGENAASPSDITLEVIRKVMSMNAAQLLELKEYISGKFNE